MRYQWHFLREKWLKEYAEFFFVIDQVDQPRRTAPVRAREQKGFFRQDMFETVPRALHDETAVPPGDSDRLTE